MNLIEAKKIFFTIFLLMLIIESLSFLGFYYYPLEIIFFWLILLITLISSLKNWANGLMIALTELFLGSQGHLFTISINNFEISIRIGIFIVLALVYFINLIRNKTFSVFRKSKFFLPSLIFFLFIGWALLNGFLKHNILANIFFDSNAFFYLFYILMFFEVITNEKIIIKIFLTLAAAVIVIFLLTLCYFLIFAYQPPLDLTLMYKWIRDKRIGEITYVTGNIYRIFLQAQIYSLIGFVIAFVFLISRYLKNNQLTIVKPLKFLIIIVTLAGSLATILCFSRSNWVGGMAAIFLLLIFLLIYFKIPFKNLIKISALFIIIIIIDLLFLYFISGNFSPNLIKNRLSNLTEDSAGISRLNQLKPLLKNIKENWLFGAGFGKTVTYQTNDPRVLKKAPSGWYTTYAFEWGYLDLLLKLGIIGFLAYLYLLIKIFKVGFALFKKVITLNQQLLILGLLAGLISLTFTHIFSPYLNHPLGFGYLLLTMAIFNYYDKIQKI